MMNQFIYLETKNFLNKIKSITWPDAFKTSFLMILGFIFLWFLYHGFFRVLIYLNTIEFIGGLLIVKLVAMIFLTFLIMLVFSNLIISFSTIFLADDLNFLMSLPITAKQIFIYKFLRTTFYSSWMVLLAFLPFLFAFGRIKSVNDSFYIVTLLFLIPFFLIASSIGTIISIVFVQLLPSQKARDIFIILGVLLVGAVYLFARFIQPENFLKADKFNEVIEYISVIQMPTAKYLPSWWFTSVLFLYVSKQWSNFWFYSFLLFSIAFILVAVTIYISQKSYYNSWADSQESSGYKTCLKWKIKNRAVSLFMKDIKIFFRDTSQWSQLLLLLALVIVYLFNIYKLPLDTFYLKSLVSFLNIGLAGFVLAAIALRFVFPLVSIEGKSFWIVKSLPITLKKFIWEKFLIAVIPLVFLGGLFIGISNFLLTVTKFISYLSFITIIFVAVSLAAMAVGFGAVFPKFKVENISQIESSTGGMIFIVFSLFYIFLVISLEAIIVRLWFVSQLYRKNVMEPGIIIIVVSALIIINFVAIFLPMYFGAKNLEVLDV
ncbi:MAG: hypothetical protein AB1349_11265 [Elusimicrobiota bacterium]